MPADPDDIAKYTNDGEVITSEDPALKAAHPEALDLGSTELEFFFKLPAHAQIQLDEKLSGRSHPAPLCEGVEVEETLGIGIDIAISPVVPSFGFIDENRLIDTVARTRAFAYETGSDRFSVELRE